MAKKIIPAMPNNPRTIPIPAAAPLDRGADATASAEIVLAVDVEDGVIDSVAVSMTVTDPVTKLDTVIVVLDAFKEVVVVVEDDDNEEVPVGLELLLVDDARVVLDDVVPRADVLKAFPG